MLSQRNFSIQPRRIASKSLDVALRNIMLRLGANETTIDILLENINGTQIPSEQITEIISELSDLQSAVEELQSNGKVYGGNIYISETEPVDAQENDIWFDLSLVKEG